MSRSILRTLDPFWTRFPFPYQHRFAVDRVATLHVARMARVYVGRELLPVYCYVVGDTLVDTGLSCYAAELSELVRRCGVTRAVLTHHHEDHAGNAAALSEQGIEILSSGLTCELISRDLPIHFYQHLIWGKMRPSRAAIFDETIRIGPYEARVIPAPGHCADQVAFHIPEEGWLFTGDAFLSERVQVFRRDEDFAATIATLRRLLALDFDALLCAHKPRFRDGKRALSAKLEWLLGIEGEVRRRSDAGQPIAVIAKRLLSPPWLAAVLTAGDATAYNLVRSILHGPAPR